MAKRFTYTTKWDDDWYLALPPRFKLAWNYICDNCDGIGFLKVSFSLMSFRIGETIASDEFKECFKDRVHWVSEDTLWIHGFIRAQYKSLSPNNKAHMNMAKKVVKTIGTTPVSNKTALALDPLLTLVRESTDPQETVDRPSGESRPRDIGYRIKDKGKNSLEEGSGEKPFLSQKALTAEVELIYRGYPRKEGKQPGFKTARAQIKTENDVRDLAQAVENYRNLCKRKGRKGDFVLMFSTFMNQWRDWLDPAHGESEDFSATPEADLSGINWSGPEGAA